MSSVRLFAGPICESSDAEGLVVWLFMLISIGFLGYVSYRLITSKRPIKSKILIGVTVVPAMAVALFILYIVVGVAVLCL